MRLSWITQCYLRFATENTLAVRQDIEHIFHMWDSNSFRGNENENKNKNSIQQAE